MQLRISGIALDHPEIELFIGHHPLDQFGIPVAQRQADFRITFFETGQNGRKHVLRNGRTGSDRQFTAERLAVPGERVVQFGIQRQQSADIAQQQLALRRQRDGIAPSDEKRHAELLLQFVDMFSHGRLRDEQLVRRTGKAEPFGHGPENFQSEIGYHTTNIIRFAHKSKHGGSIARKVAGSMKYRRLRPTEQPTYKKNTARLWIFSDTDPNYPEPELNVCTVL